MKFEENYEEAICNIEVSEYSLSGDDLKKVFCYQQSKIDFLNAQVKLLEKWIGEACWKISDAEQILQQDYPKNMGVE